jgi:hypothetical protein
MDETYTVWARFKDGRLLPHHRLDSCAVGSATRLGGTSWRDSRAHRSKDVIGEVGDQRWTLVLRDPRILTRDGDPFLFRAYSLIELVLCLLTSLLIVAPVLARVAQVVAT